MIQNDAIMLESVVEYCNRVNSLLLVIKFNAACWNQYWEYSGIYIALYVHHVADIKYDTEWCDYARECCRNCNIVNSRLVVIKLITACWYQYWEYSGIYIVLLVHHVADIKYDTEWFDYAWECCRIL